MLFPIAIAAALWAGPAPIDIAVVVPEIDGQIDPETAGLLAAAVSDGLARGRVAAKAVTRDKPCPTDACAVTAGISADAAFALRATFFADDRDYRFDLRLIDVHAPDRVIVAGDDCDLCGLAEAQAKVADLAAGLAERIAEADAPAVVVVSSRPPKATVRAGDAVLGVTPFESELAPGPHTLRFSLEGYIARERSVVAVAGSRARVDAALQPDPKSGAPRRLHIVGGVLDGVGIVAVAAGATLLAVDGRPHQASCSDAMDGITGRCPQRLDTLVGGIATVSTGVTALVTGIVLHAVARRRVRRSGAGPHTSRSRPRQAAR